MSYNACQLNQYYAPDCGERENAGIRGVIYLRQGLEWPDFDISNLTPLYQFLVDAYDAGYAQVIPSVKGTSNGSDPITTEGRGGNIELYTGRTYEVSYQHIYSCINKDFYDSLAENNDHEIVFATNSMIWRSVSPVSAIAKDPITQPQTDIVDWDVTVRWWYDGLTKCYPVDRTFVTNWFQSTERLNETLACFTPQPISLVTCPS